MNFIVMSPNYELLRYGHEQIKNQTTDAHSMKKLSKFVIGTRDLIDSEKPPTSDNFRFEARQADDADVVVFVGKDRKTTVLKDLNTNL